MTLVCLHLGTIGDVTAQCAVINGDKLYTGQHLKVDSICEMASQKLRNMALKNAYKKQKRLSESIEQGKENLSRITTKTQHTNDKEKPPGRAIVSGRGTLTEDISGFIDSHLEPLMGNIPSFVKDTTDFIRKLSTLPTRLPDHKLLVTLDVSPYTLIFRMMRGAGMQEVLSEGNHLNADEIDLRIDFILRHKVFAFMENL
ncbi:hypothetical protein BSL78_10543 [Apostichopus japonicus]|uniref:Uncharacterized protein n=1 Tax=Stichopus japonicus TaxID=307972 RepID=A0A2G8KX14_STIJA|nr:hypothetical protein BSL78_10543 [Apostichopus japonicus]